jgi:hypothetical protein
LAPAQIDDCIIPPPYAGIQAARLINWQGNEKDADFAKLASRVKACLENHSSLPATVQLSPRKIRIANNLVLWSLVLLLAGFLAGFGAYKTILKIAQLETVPSSTIKQLEAEIESLKKENATLETKLANYLSPPPQPNTSDPNERVLFYKAQILSLRGDIEARSSNTLDTVLRQRSLQLANLIGEIDESQLKPAIKIIQHEYRGWAFLMGVSTFAETPPEYITAASRIDYATKAVTEFDLTLDRMADITRDYRASVPAAIPIYEWMTGSSDDLNRTHYLKAVALAVIARAGGGTPQAAIDELSAIKSSTYLVTFPAENNPDLAWALQQSTPSKKSSTDHGRNRFGGRTADPAAYAELPGSPRTRSPPQRYSRGPGHSGADRIGPNSAANAGTAGVCARVLRERGLGATRGRRGGWGEGGKARSKAATPARTLTEPCRIYRIAFAPRGLGAASVWEALTKTPNSRGHSGSPRGRYENS